LEQQDIYLLITRHFNQQTTRDEEFFLAAWLDISEENRLTYAVLEEIWAASQQQHEQVVPDTALEQVKARIRRQRRVLVFRLSAAAAAVILILGSVFLMRSQLSDQRNIIYTAKSSLPGQVLEVKLADGTQVHLAPGSTIRYAQDFGKKSRQVILEGEALFDVTKQADHPFMVQAGAVKVQVLGTKFNVSHYKNDQQTAVSLVNGRVQVALPSKQQPYEMQPGQQLTYDSIAGTVSKTDFDDEEAVTGWASRVLVFRNETLATAAAKIEKLYNVKISFDDPAIARFKLFARFNDKPLRYVLDVIKATDNLDYSLQGNDVTFFTNNMQHSH
jgi:transmembrane sensor